MLAYSLATAVEALPRPKEPNSGVMTHNKEKDLSLYMLNFYPPYGYPVQEACRGGHPGP